MGGHEHVHGRLHRHCQKPECVEARAKYAKRWAYDRSHGVKRIIDSTEVRNHLATLRGQDMSMRSIAGAAGVTPTTVCRLLDGQEMVRRDIAAKILAVKPDEIPKTPSKQTTEVFVSRVGTVRRLQALMYMQWRAEDLVAYGAPTDRWVYNLLHQQGRWVTRSTHDLVAAIYAQLHDKLGPSPRTRTRAIKRGFRGPMDWVDIDHDPEPDISEGIEVEEDYIDHAAVQRRMDGDKSLKLSFAEQDEVVARCLADGWSKKRIEAITGVNVERAQERERERKRASTEEEEVA